MNDLFIAPFAYTGLSCKTTNCKLCSKVLQGRKKPIHRKNACLHGTTDAPAEVNHIPACTKMYREGFTL